MSPDMMTKLSALLTYCFIAILGGLIANTSSAQVVVSIDSPLEIRPNSISKVIVAITGDAEDISLFGYEFRLSPLAGSSSQIRFLEEDESFLSDPDYVFFNNSFASSDGSGSSVGTVTTSVLPSDTFVGGDSTADFENISLNDAKTLIEMFVQHDSGPADPGTTVGDQFRIELVPQAGDSSEFLGGNSNTGFADAALDGIAFDSNFGTIVVVAVPEPASSVALTLLLLPVLVRRRL